MALLNNEEYHRIKNSLNALADNLDKDFQALTNGKTYTESRLAYRLGLAIRQIDNAVKNIERFMQER